MVVRLFEDVFNFDGGENIFRLQVRVSRRAGYFTWQNILLSATDRSSWKPAAGYRKRNPT
jgi:hypothetical protein